MAVQVREVEFIGGPFDGFIYEFPSSSQQLPSILAVPMNQRLLWLPKIDFNAKTEHGKNAAFYDLVKRNGNFRYRFWGIHKPPDVRQSTNPWGKLVKAFKSIFD